MKYFVSLICCCFTTAVYGASCDRTTDIEVIRDCYLRTLDCAALTDSSDRMACYDRIYQQSESATMAKEQLVPAETPAIVAIEQVETIVDQVGSEENEAATSDSSEPAEAKEQLVPEETPVAVVVEQEKILGDLVGSEENEAATSDSSSPEEITARIVAVHKNLYGDVTVTLSNDQVWRELDPSRLRYKVGEKVVIRKGFYRSYKLQINGKGLSSKVRLIR